MRLATMFTLILTLGACATPPPAPPSTSSVAIPPSPPPEPLNALVMESEAARGRLTLVRNTRYVPEPLSGNPAIDALYARERARQGRPPYYTVREVVSAGTVHQPDDLGDWSFSYTKVDLRSLEGNVHGLSIRFANKSADTVEIDWNRTVILDPSGRTHPVIHRGVRLADRGGSVPPSVVPAGAVLDDFVFPGDLIFLTRGQYGGWSATEFFETLRPGASISLSVGLRTGKGVTDRSFRFRIVQP